MCLVLWLLIGTAALSPLLEIFTGPLEEVFSGASASSQVRYAGASHPVTMA